MRYAIEEELAEKTEAIRAERRMLMVIDEELV